jgi:regulatory protein
VEVQLDGVTWRVVPLACAAAARLSVGVALDRERARALARALRRERALAKATRLLGHADHSRAALDERLAARGVRDGERVATLDLLTRAGLVDDPRTARQRARLLAARGRGDAAIRHDLETRGYAEEVVRDALARLEPEAVRAARLVEESGRTPRAARRLLSSGFDADVVESVIAACDDGGLG